MATSLMHVQLDFILVHDNEASLKSDHKKLRISALTVENCKFCCRCLATVVAMATVSDAYETRLHAGSCEPIPIQIRLQKVEKFRFEGPFAAKKSRNWPSGNPKYAN